MLTKGIGYYIYKSVGKISCFRKSAIYSFVHMYIFRDSKICNKPLVVEFVNIYNKYIVVLCQDKYRTSYCIHQNELSRDPHKLLHKNNKFSKLTKQCQHYKNEKDQKPVWFIE